MAFIMKLWRCSFSPFLVDLFLLLVLHSASSAGYCSLRLEKTVLERDAVVQEERIVFSADVANAVAGIERASLGNDN